MSKKLLGIIVLAVAAVILAGVYVDRTVTINTGQSQPADATASNKVVLQDYGAAPDFALGSNWLNSQPLTIKDLRGKVVLVDFWTYSCINCIRTLSYVTKWYNAYQGKGLVVIGVHTPEFTFEKDGNNVKAALEQFGIHYPVVQDNNYSIWNSYQNQYWPAEYLINQEGHIVRESFGEGDYDKTENAIRYLLGMSATNVAVNNDNLNKVASPEMYFGTDRTQYLSSRQTTSGFNPLARTQTYALVQNVDLNTYSLGGTWQSSGQNIQLVGASGQINLKFHSGKVFMVASSDTPAILSISVDGRQQPSVTVQASKLYTLFDSKDYTDHVIEITIDHPSFEAFTFTFG